MSKSKSKSGPAVRSDGRSRPRKAASSPRTPRLRYIEPATTTDGNPFFALRVPAALLRAFKAYAHHKGQTPTVCARSLMAAVTGYELDEVES